MSDNIMDSETKGEPASVEQGREPPAGSRGETGQKEGIDLSPAVPIEAEQAVGIKWECMSCGTVYDDPIVNCPKDDGAIRKVGISADPVYAERFKDSTEAAPPASSSGPDGQTATTDETKGATIEDLSARGEGNKPVPESGDNRLNSEKVHPADAGSSGGGGGTGAG
ncbi:MAG: hypothetical protein ACR2FO_01680 [Actinomycetota bacterium]